MNSNTKNTDDYLKSLPAWQAEALSIFRKNINKASSKFSEEIKWGVPVFLYVGRMLFAMSAFKAHVKYNFIANGALLDDPQHLFNNGFDSKKSRGIDIKQGESIAENALSELIAQAIAKLA